MHSTWFDNALYFQFRADLFFFHTDARRKAKHLQFTYGSREKIYINIGTCMGRFADPSSA